MNESSKSNTDAKDTPDKPPELWVKGFITACLYMMRVRNTAGPEQVRRAEMRLKEFLAGEPAPPDHPAVNDARVIWNYAVRFAKSSLRPTTLVQQNCKPRLLSMVEIGRTALELYDMELYSVIPILARASADLFVDIALIAKGQEYIDRLLLSGVKAEHRALSYEKPRLIAAFKAKAEDIDRQIAGLEEIIASLENKGVKRLVMEKRGEHADMSPGWELTYHRYSSSVHSGFDALLERHVAIDPATGNPAMQLFKPDPRPARQALNDMKFMLYNAVGLTHRAFGIPWLVDDRLVAIATSAIEV